MNKQNKLTKWLVIPALMAAAVVILAAAFPARMQHLEQDKQNAQPNNGETYLIGLLRVASNRTVRIAAVNGSDRDIPVEMALVDAQGKVLIQCNGFAASGKGVADVLDTSGTQLPTDLYARYRTRNKNDLKDLALTVQVIDNQTNLTEITLTD